PVSRLRPPPRHSQISNRKFFAILPAAPLAHNSVPPLEAAARQNGSASRAISHLLALRQASANEGPLACPEAGVSQQKATTLLIETPRLEFPVTPTKSPHYKILIETKTAFSTSVFLISLPASLLPCLLASIPITSCAASPAQSLPIYPSPFPSAFA